MVAPCCQVEGSIIRRQGIRPLALDSRGIGAPRDVDILDMFDGDAPGIDNAAGTGEVRHADLHASHGRLGAEDELQGLELTSGR